MTPGEEEIMRVYEKKIYRPPDMIEKPGGLHIKGSSIRDKELLRDTPIPGTPTVPSQAQRPL